MKDQFYEIPGRLAGANELIGGINRHRYVGAKIKKDETERCRWAASRLIKIDYPVKLTISWFEPNARRDIDNISFGTKFILDGLIQAGKLKNDGRKQVQAIEHEFPKPCPGNPRIFVHIREYVNPQ